MTTVEAIKHLENMKWLKGYDNTKVDGVPLSNIIDDIIDILKEKQWIGAEDGLPIDRWESAF